jgi:hypothetical protein
VRVGTTCVEVNPLFRIDEKTSLTCMATKHMNDAVLGAFGAALLV